ncbi:MAG: hypothetical protein HPY83_10475 [Anaerolineae bacterium]|nr:hypothetical protein [Anaerolineae bacterium]
MAGAAEQELAVRQIMAGVEERVKAMLEHAEQQPEASLGELEEEISELGRVCIAGVLEVATEGRRQAEEQLGLLGLSQSRTSVGRAATWRWPATTAGQRAGEEQRRCSIR